MISNLQRQQLLDAYSKTALENGIFIAVKKFIIKNGVDLPKLFPSNTILKIAVDKVLNKKTLNKAELAVFCFSVFENKEIYQSFVKSLPTYIEQLFEILLWRKSMPYKEAEKTTGVSLVEEFKLGFHHRENELRKDLYIFGVNIITSWSSVPKDYILYLPQALKQVIADYYPKPLYYNFIAIEKTPNGKHTFSAEKQIFLEMPAILSYHLQGAIKYASSGKPNEASVNKMLRVCNIVEFYQTDDLKNIRAQFIAAMVYGYKLKDINIDTVELVKTLFTSHYKAIYTPQVILTHLKGWGYVNSHYLNDTSFPLLLDIFKLLPVDKWISAENLHAYINTRTIEIAVIESYPINNTIYFDEPSKHGDYTNKAYASTNTTKLVREAFINGSVFLLASFGLLEIMYTDVNTKALNETYYSAYDGLQYFKLTALGAYVFDISKSYKAEFTSPQNKLHLSEDSMVILAEGDITVIDVMLANYTEKEGNNRYRVTSAAFFKDCKNTNSIETKINLFKKTISAKLPRYWEATFNEWKANAKKVKEDLSTVVFKIPADAKELHNLIAKDAVLKAIMFKAEGFHVLVAKDNESKFKHRMKDLGYFID